MKALYDDSLIRPDFCSGHWSPESVVRPTKLMKDERLSDGEVRDKYVMSKWRWQNAVI